MLFRSWDSWEDDALVGDKEAGVFVDAQKLHRLDHDGAYFQVRGPLNIGRSNQGQPVIFQAGASEDGRGFAASHAEVVFCGPQTIGEAQSYWRDVKARAARAGREEGLPLILPGVAPIVGRTDAEAEGFYRELVELTSIEIGRAHV